MLYCKISTNNIINNAKGSHENRLAYDCPGNVMKLTSTQQCLYQLTHFRNIYWLIDWLTLNNIVSRCEDRMYLVQVKYCVSWKSYKCQGLWWCYPGLGGWKVILYCLETSNERESIMTCWKSYKCQRLWWCYPGLGGWKVILYCLETSNERESIMTWRMLPWYGEIQIHKMSLRKWIKLWKELGNEGIENNLKRPGRGVQYDLKLNHASDQEN